MHDTITLVHAEMARAATSMARYANRRRRAVSISVGDRVWVHADHLGFSPEVSRKLTPRYFGPCTVTRQVNPVAFEVTLPPHLQIHNVFHVSQFCMHIAGHPSQAAAPPPPIVVDGSLEYEVEDVLDVHTVGRGCKRDR